MALATIVTSPLWHWGQRRTMVEMSPEERCAILAELVDHKLFAVRELAILTARAPEVPARLAAQIVAFVQRLRASDLFKLPGVAETLDWGHALVALGQVELSPETVEATLGVLLKYQDDLAKVTGATARALVEHAKAP